MANIHAYHALDMSAPHAVGLSAANQVAVQYVTEQRTVPASQVLVGLALLLYPYDTITIDVRTGINSFSYQDDEYDVTVNVGLVPLDGHPATIYGYSLATGLHVGMEVSVSGITLPVDEWPYTLRPFAPEMLAGNDSIEGSASPDTLLGFGGNDVIRSGPGGGDTLAGGAGNDLYQVEGPGVTIEEQAGQGLDTVVVAYSDYPAPGTYALPANVEVLVLYESVQQAIVGNGASNVLRGNSGNNVLDGAGGNDTLHGDAGNDTLIGGSGADSMIGGTGSDAYARDAAGDVVVELAGQGNDIVRSSVSYALPVNVERLTLTGANHVNATGNGAANVLTGNAGNNLLNGSGGADTLRGMNGNDTLVWDAADTLLDGGGGAADALRVGGGNLNLTLIANDRILNVERIDLTNPGANILTLNAQDVLDLSSTTNTLTVLGGANDSINIVGAFANQGTAAGFTRYTFGGATLLVEQEITSVA